MTYHVIHICFEHFAMEKILVLFSVISLSYAQLAGGWVEQDLNDKATRALALAAVQELDTMSNSLYRNKMVHLVKVESQVVAGINYRITLEMAPTSCRKGDNTDLEGCATTQPSQECVITYWVQPWTKTQQITDHTCHTPETPTTDPPLVGGSKEGDPDAEAVSEAAQFAMDELNARSNSLYRMQLMDVRRVTQQTVAGVKYQMALQVGFSECKNSVKNQGADLGRCPVNPANGAPQECTVEVLEQVWSDPKYQLLSHNCVPGANVAPGKSNSIDDVMGQKRSAPAGNLGGDDHDIGNYGSFVEFQQKYNKQYKDKDEELKRFAVFRDNMKTARKLQDSEQGSATYGATKFADLTEAEFHQWYLTPKWNLTVDPDMAQATIPREAAPKAFDWRDHNAVTPVKNQGQCGSCWAFSTTGNIEGQWAIHKNRLLSLSEQELVDCDKVDQGCNGGLPSNAYKVIQRLGGLETEEDYPYEARGEKCSFQRSEARAYINGSQSLPKDEGALASWLAKNGPISIGINAFAMQFYMGGVSHPWSFLCNPGSLDHGVLIVGYGVKSGWFSNTPYWIVKNSWGPDWGEKGYYLVYRGGGVCGLNTMATSAVVN